MSDWYMQASCKQNHRFVYNSRCEIIGTQSERNLFAVCICVIPDVSFDRVRRVRRRDVIYYATLYGSMLSNNLFYREAVLRVVAHFSQNALSSSTA